MAIFHSHAGIVSRSSGRSAVAASAYIGAKQMIDERQNIIHDYTKKSNVLISKILAPTNAPDWVKESDTLWNRAENFEDEIASLRFRGHKDPDKNIKSEVARFEYLQSAQTAQTLECSLPVELGHEACIKLVEEYLTQRFVSRSLIVDYAIHWEIGNPHFHAMITRRAIDLETGSFSKVKDRNIVEKDQIKESRKIYADKVNLYLEREGIEARVDHRSFKEIGLNIEPSKHRGWKASELLRMGHYSRIESENEKIRQENISILFDSPEEIIKEVAHKKPVFTNTDISNAIMKRVGGDEVLFAMLSEKLEQIEIPDQVSGSATSKASFTANIANNNEIVYEGIRSPEDQERYHELLAQNAAVYAGNILIESDQSILLGQNIRDKLLYTSIDNIELEERIFTLSDQIAKKAYNERSDEFHLAKDRINHFIVQTEKGFAGAKFSSEQISAINYLCDLSSLEQVNLKTLIGRAGSGKTTLLKVVADSYKDAGFRVIGTSFQGKTVDIMANEIGIECYTIDHLRHAWSRHKQYSEKIKSGLLNQASLKYAQNNLTRLQEKKFTSKDVVIIDEANMVSAYLWSALLEEIQLAGAKLIIVQDPAQIKAHDGRDIARGLMNKYGYVELTKVLRQKQEWQRDASLELNNHNIIEGLAPYVQSKNLLWYEDGIDCYKQIIQDYIDGVNNFPNEKHLFMSFLNVKVNFINHGIHKNLKAVGYLSNHHMIGGREFSVGERIVFIDKNENTGKIVKTVENELGVKAYGVKNGTFGVIDSFAKEKIAVKLEDGRLVEFDPVKYPHFTYGYGITINKAEGYTCDRSYVLFDQKMDANLTLIAMTRHREGLKGYVIRDEFADFKDLVDKVGYSQKRDLISDYTITDDVKPYYDRVKAYKTFSCEAAEILSDISDNNERASKAQKDKLYCTIKMRNKLAQEICKEYSFHSIFSQQANVKKHVIETHAGVRERLLSDVEVEASLRVEKYVAKVLQVASFAQKPTKLDPDIYNKIKLERNRLANEIISNQALHRQFLKNEVVLEQLTSHAMSYQAHMLEERNILEASYSKLLVQYLETRSELLEHIDFYKNVIGLGSSRVSESILANLMENHVIMSEAETKSLIDKRDNLALNLVEANDNQHVTLKTPHLHLVSTLDNEIMSHASHVEEKRLYQINEIDRSVKASITLIYNNLNLRSINLYIGQNHEAIACDVSDRYKELYVNMCEIKATEPTKEEVQILIARAFIEHYYYQKSFAVLRENLIDEAKPLNTPNLYKVSQEAEIVAAMAGKKIQELEQVSVNNGFVDNKSFKAMTEEFNKNLKDYGVKDFVITAKGYELRENRKNELMGDLIQSGIKPNIADHYSDLKLKFEDRYDSAHITQIREEFFEQAAQHLSTKSVDNSEDYIRKNKTELYSEIEMQYQLKIDCLQDHVTWDASKANNHKILHDLAITRSDDYHVLTDISLKHDVKLLEHDLLYKNNPISAKAAIRLNINLNKDFELFKQHLNQSIEQFNLDHHHSLQRELGIDHDK
jgi:nucleoside-triphosphatase THEP1